MPDTQHGFDFEEYLATLFGMERVPGSGNQFHAKLDVTDSGMLSRWSLKSTKHKSYPISQAEIDEAVFACEGPGGKGEIPVWALRVGDDDHILICFRPHDIKRIMEEEIKLVREDKTDAKLRRASLPELLRDDDN